MAGKAARRRLYHMRWRRDKRKGREGEKRGY